MQVVTTVSGEQRVMWCAQDAFVIKLCEQTLSTLEVLSISKAVTHVKRIGAGRIKDMQALTNVLKTHRFVCRTDIKGYYQSICKVRLDCLFG